MSQHLTLNLYRYTIARAPLGIMALAVGFNLAVVMQMPLDGTLVWWDSMAILLILPLLFLSHSKPGPSTPRSSSLAKGDMADLLAREVVPLDMSAVYPSLQGKIVLVTGAAGSIGSELCWQLLGSELEALIALDTNETGLFDLVESVRTRAHPHSERLQPFIGDITDIARCSQLFAEKRPHVLFHVAAYKHVPLLEQHPDLAIRINTLATYDLCRLAQTYGVARFVYVSTDKAAHPVSVMGASKRLAEMIVQTMALSTQNSTQFCAVRFGNVIGSRGSVVPIFLRQIEQGGPITVTDPNATRYFMTIPEACGLLMLTSILTSEEGLYLLDMGEPVWIMDLARRIAQQHGLRLGQDIPLVYTGLRPGERLHETLVAPNEELLPTSHQKIFRISHKDSLPPIATLLYWIDTLLRDVQQGDIPQFRDHLFSYVRAEALATSGSTH